MLTVSKLAARGGALNLPAQSARQSAVKALRHHQLREESKSRGSEPRLCGSSKFKSRRDERLERKMRVGEQESLR